MKEFVFSLVCVLLLSVNVYATTFLCRISSGEVTEKSDTNSGFDLFDSTYWEVLIDPSLPDGSVIKDPNGQRRVLGYAKINDNGVVRNATQNEIDGFKDFVIDDRNERYAQQALQRLATDSKFRMVMAAIIKGIIKEDNLNRQFDRDLLDAIANSTSLLDFQRRAAALDRPVDREFQDAKDYVVSQVSKDD